MYKRKFSKTKAVVENDLVQLTKTPTDSSLSVSKSSMSLVFSNSNSEEDESPESPSMLDDFTDFPIEKKRKTVDAYVDNTVDCDSEPLFDIDGSYSHLKQMLLSCGLHLKYDQNILC